MLKVAELCNMSAKVVSQLSLPNGNDSSCYDFNCASTKGTWMHERERERERERAWGLQLLE